MYRRLALAALLASAAPAAAQDEIESAGRLAAVQPRRNYMKHELGLLVGHLPLDAFYKGVGPEIVYAYHASDGFALELKGMYSFNLQTTLREELKDRFGVAPTASEQMLYSLSLSIVAAPGYGKFAFMNRSVTNAQVFVLVGGVLGRLTQNFKPGPSAGAGVRFFLDERVSVRFDVRYALLFGRLLTPVVSVSLGISLNLGEREAS